MFKDNIVITDIKSIIYVTANKKKGSRTIYNGNLPTHELIFKISGESNIFFSKKKLHNVIGTVSYLPKGIINAEYYVDTIEAGDCIDVFFNTSSSMPDEAFNVNLANNEVIQSLFKKMHIIWIARHSGYQYKCMALFYDILAEIVKSQSQYLPEHQLQKIFPAIEYIKEHCFDKNFDYSILPKLCDISYTYFRKLFIKKFNTPPVQYVTYLRMQYACELLLSQEYNITEIAEIVGYENVYYFSKVFKKNIGCSPSKYIDSMTV